VVAAPTAAAAPAAEVTYVTVVAGCQTDAVLGGTITVSFAGLPPGPVTTHVDTTGPRVSPGTSTSTFILHTSVLSLPVSSLPGGTYRVSAAWAGGGESGSWGPGYVTVPACAGPADTLGSPGDPAVGIGTFSAEPDGAPGYDVVYRDGTTGAFREGAGPQLTPGSGDLVPATDPITAVPESSGTYGLFVSDARGDIFPKLPCDHIGCLEPSTLTYVHLAAPIVAMDEVPGYLFGYWLASSDGGVFNLGARETVTASGPVPGYAALPFYGSAAGLPLRAPIVGIAGLPTATGYWLAGADGGVFSFGGAGYYGSLGATHLDAPIVGIAATPDGRGYWLVASDGGVFTFGDAQFYGSLGGTHLGAPIVGMAPMPTGRGYWLVGADGGVFTFGDAPFYGSFA
jgi:hypothetical protein